MSDEPLGRIEKKLDGLVTSVDDLQATVIDLAVGQATLEHRFSAIDHEWTQVEQTLAEIRPVAGLRQQVERGFASVVDRLESRVRPLEESARHHATRLDDHERRIQALEGQRQ